MLNHHVLITYADGRSVAAEYDAGDRLLSLEDSVSGQIAWTYDSFDRRKMVTDPEVSPAKHGVTISPPESIGAMRPVRRRR